jgi:hypothetical protein
MNECLGAVLAPTMVGSARTRARHAETHEGGRGEVASPRGVSELPPSCRGGAFGRWPERKHVRATWSIPVNFSFNGPSVHTCARVHASLSFTGHVSYACARALPAAFLLLRAPPPPRGGGAGGNQGGRGQGRRDLLRTPSDPAAACQGQVCSHQRRPLTPPPSHPTVTLTDTHTLSSPFPSSARPAASESRFSMARDKSAHALQYRTTAVPFSSPFSCPLHLPPPPLPTPASASLPPSPPLAPLSLSSLASASHPLPLPPPLPPQDPRRGRRGLLPSAAGAPPSPPLSVPPGPSFRPSLPRRAAPLPQRCQL